MDGSEVDWQLDPPVQASKVYVGPGVVFENIPSECTAAGDMPGCPNAKP